MKGTKDASDATCSTSKVEEIGNQHYALSRYRKGRQKWMKQLVIYATTSQVPAATIVKGRYVESIAVNSSSGLVK